MTKSHKKKLRILAIIFVGLCLLFGSHYIKRYASISPENTKGERYRLQSLRYDPEDKKYGTMSGKTTNGEKLTGTYKQISSKKNLGIYNISEEGDGKSVENHLRKLIDLSRGVSKGNFKKYVGELSGSNGTEIVCEFYLSLVKSHGVGACLASNGAKWRITF